MPDPTYHEFILAFREVLDVSLDDAETHWQDYANRTFSPSERSEMEHRGAAAGTEQAWLFEQKVFGTELFVGN